MPLPLVFTPGFLPGAAVSGFFVFYYTTARVSVTHTAGARDTGLLWESVERVPGAAKIEPLRERLSGMCGSVRH